MSDDLRLKIERVLAEHVLSTGRAAQLARIIIESGALAEHAAAIWDEGTLAASAYSAQVVAAVNRHAPVPARPVNPYRQQRESVGPENG